MEKKVLSLTLLFCSLSAMTPEAKIPSRERASILQTDIVPYLESEDTSNQLNSTQEVLALTESNLDATESILESTQEVLAILQSQILN